MAIQRLQQATPQQVTPQADTARAAQPTPFLRPDATPRAIARVPGSPDILLICDRVLEALDRGDIENVHIRNEAALRLEDIREKYGDDACAAAEKIFSDVYRASTEPYPPEQNIIRHATKGAIQSIAGFRFVYELALAEFGDPTRALAVAKDSDLGILRNSHYIYPDNILRAIATIYVNHYCHYIRMGKSPEEAKKQAATNANYLVNWQQPERTPLYQAWNKACRESSSTIMSHEGAYDFPGNFVDSDNQNLDTDLLKAYEATKNACLEIIFYLYESPEIFETASSGFSPQKLADYKRFALSTYQDIFYVCLKSGLDWPSTTVLAGKILEICVCQEYSLLGFFICDSRVFTRLFPDMLHAEIGSRIYTIDNGLRSANERAFAAARHYKWELDALTQRTLSELSPAPTAAESKALELAADEIALEIFASACHATMSAGIAQDPHFNIDAAIAAGQSALPAAVPEAIRSIAAITRSHPAVSTGHVAYAFAPTYCDSLHSAQSASLNPQQKIAAALEAGQRAANELAVQLDTLITENPPKTQAASEYLLSIINEARSQGKRLSLDECKGVFDFYYFGVYPKLLTAYPNATAGDLYYVGKSLNALFAAALDAGASCRDALSLVRKGSMHVAPRGRPLPPDVALAAAQANIEMVTQGLRIGKFAPYDIAKYFDGLLDLFSAAFSTAYNTCIDAGLPPDVALAAAKSAAAVFSEVCSRIMADTHQSYGHAATAAAEALCLAAQIFRDTYLAAPAQTKLADAHALCGDFAHSLNGQQWDDIMFDSANVRTAADAHALIERRHLDPRLEAAIVANHFPVTPPPGVA